MATCVRDCMFAFGRFFGYSSSVSRKSSIEKNEAKLQVLLLEMVELKVPIGAQLHYITVCQAVH